jgi:hypothetical protein
LAEGAERARLLSESVAAFRAALEVNTERDAPYYHRLLQEYLAAAQALLGQMRQR